jgi:hypothetical protein
MTLSKSKHHALSYETLESRTMFSVDAMIPHNFVMPEDTNQSGDVSVYFRRFVDRKFCFVRRPNLAAVSELALTLERQKNLGGFNVA